MENLYPWFDDVWHCLSDKKDKCSHALLFIGRKGIGKSELLHKFAQFMLCDNSENQGCNCCQSCRWFLAHAHPDYFKLVGDDGVVKVDEVRALKEWLTFAPHYYRRVIVVEDLGNFNIFAQNAFLKILEEPPPKVYFIMATSNLELVLPTVYSRCQPFYLQINFEKVKTWFHRQGISSKFSCFQETPLIAKKYHEKYGVYLPNLINELEICLKNPANFFNLQNIQNQFVLDDLINIYYILMQQLTIFSNNCISFSENYCVDFHNIFVFESWLINLQKTRKQINLNEELIRENLVLRFIEMFGFKK